MMRRNENHVTSNVMMKSKEWNSYIDDRVPIRNESDGYHMIMSIKLEPKWIARQRQEM